MGLRDSIRDNRWFIKYGDTGTADNFAFVGNEYMITYSGPSREIGAEPQCRIPYAIQGDLFPLPPVKQRAHSEQRRKPELTSWIKTLMCFSTDLANFFVQKEEYWPTLWSLLTDRITCVGSQTIAPSEFMLGSKSDGQKYCVEFLNSSPDSPAVILYRQRVLNDLGCKESKKVHF